MKADLTKADADHESVIKIMDYLNINIVQGGEEKLNLSLL
jgi:hypothetical protein